ncbi:Asp-tRNA(Asn)/Glu-tRNA(Gln) amidotransferase subunit GatB [bacterium]|nr:Asp-tRNA(Asn)/Glu-tRNA(Gln) amidotransferase subunit GatB [bacterium]
MKYEPIIGLEIHIQLNTKRKMFCGCSTDIWKKPANSVVCPVCLGLPGALPVPNLEAIKKVQLFGLALGCKLNTNSNFDRKHYFYPDLPKGFQISQYKKPFCYEGVLELKEGNVEIERIHLEEDTGKSIHDAKTDETLLDFNKSGMPLMELVTKPQIKSPEHAHEVALKIAELAKFLNVSNVNMERGNLRIEPSISLRPLGQEDLPNYKVELKNINSFRFMRSALKYEIKRQTKELNEGNKIPQQTRGYKESTKTTFIQRVKETDSDYRYFPEPDIPPFEFSKEYIEEINKLVPVLPSKLKEELHDKHKISTEKIDMLAKLSRVEFVINLIKAGLSAKDAVNESLGLSKGQYKEVFENLELFVQKIKDSKKHQMDDDSEILQIVKKVIKENTASVNDYKAGNINALNFLIGQVMKKSGGKANPAKAREILVNNL